MTFLLQFVALRMLEVYCFRAPNRDLSVTLLSMERSQISIPTSSWEIMQTLVKESLGSWHGISDVEVKKAVDILESATGQCPSKCTSLLTFRPLVVQHPEQTEIRFTGGMHCETALMMIGKYIQHVLYGGSDGDLMSVCKVRALSLAYLIHHNTFYRAWFNLPRFRFRRCAVLYAVTYCQPWTIPRRCATVGLPLIRWDCQSGSIPMTSTR